MLHALMERDDIFDASVLQLVAMLAVEEMGYMEDFKWSNFFEFLKCFRPGFK